MLPAPVISQGWKKCAKQVLSNLITAARLANSVEHARQELRVLRDYLACRLQWRSHFAVHLRRFIVKAWEFRQLIRNVGNIVPQGAGLNRINCAGYNALVAECLGIV